MLSKMMLSGANALILDEPTNHLDMESIIALNDGLIAFPGVILFCSHDYQLVSSLADRVVEITPDGIIDRMTGYDEYLEDGNVSMIRPESYHCHQALRL
jgi:ATPase subunit of ABC transporter with duplicated ATPase domains